MQRNIKRVEYFHATVRDEPGEAYRFLERLSAAGVNLLAFHAVPAGLEQMQLMLFPESSELLGRVAAERGLELLGPHDALMIQGDDELGALADVHRLLFDAGVNVAASSGLSDGRGGYGYLIYVSDGDVAAAASALGL
jgi:hypothetical protein